MRRRAQREAGGDEAGDTFAQPAPQHADHLDGGSHDEAGAMAHTIGEPAGRQLEAQESQITGREDRGDDGGRDVFLLDPPEEIQPVHDALDGGDPVRQVENEVSSEAGSVRRH